MILAKKRLDRRNLVRRDEGCFQIRAQPQQRDPPRVQFVIVDVADIGVLIGVGHNGVENKHLQSGLLEPVVQRKVEMLVDSMYTRAGRLWVWHRPRIRSTAPCTERVLLCRILYDLPTISCIGSAIAIRLKSALMSIPTERYGFLLAS